MAEMLQGRLDTAVKETREVNEELSSAREEIVSLNTRFESMITRPALSRGI